MEKSYLLIIISLCVILSGCSERTLTFDRKYPDTTDIDKFRSKKSEELIKGKMGTEFSHILGSNIKPDTIKITYVKSIGEEDENKVQYESQAYPLQYCWRNTVEECNHLIPTNLHINTAPLESTLYSLSKVTLKTGDRVTINMFNINQETPLADDVELYILERDGSLTPHQLSKLDNYNYAFYVPSVEYSYILMIKAIFETYIGGIAYYPVNINVR